MRALVLSGGAAKGSFITGILHKWILEDNLDYEIMCGISVGAINAACLAQSPMGNIKESFLKLEAFWNSLTTKQVYKSWFLFGKVASLWKTSVFNTQPLIDKIRKELDVNAVANSGRLLRVGAVCWETGEYKLGTEKDANLAEWVLASAAFPVFMKPIFIDGKWWTDGGARNVTPIGDAIRLGATEIDVIMCSNPELPNEWSTKDKNAVPDYVFRTLDLMGDEIIRNDLQVCGLKNDLAELGAPYKKIKIRIVQPDRKLTEDSLNFDQESIQRMMKIGYSQAKKDF